MPADKLGFLALDGDGARNFSSLIILQQIMAAVNPENPPKPCEFFDLIGGTGIGGIIAIMLGRLEMSVDECLEAFVALVPSVFGGNNKSSSFRKLGNLLQVTSRFDAAALERAVKELLHRHGLDRDELLQAPPEATCKVFVCTTDKRTVDTVCLTSYYSPRSTVDLFRHTKIWEACRATTATPGFLDPITIKAGPLEQEFVSGALGANNPVYELWAEAQALWGPARLEYRLKCMISIGSGLRQFRPLSYQVTSLLSTFVELATETEKTAERFRRERRILDGEERYYRFNVIRGLEDIDSEDFHMINDISARTSSYLADGVVAKSIKACASHLSDPGPIRVNLLSVDGGGVRGLTSLLVLQSIMEEITRIEVIADPGSLGRVRIPADYFDLAGGTSTGGLICIMLFRLRMDVQTAIDQYKKLSPKIFHQGFERYFGANILRSIFGISWFKGRALEDGIKDILKKSLPEDEKSQLDTNVTEATLVPASGSLAEVKDYPKSCRTFVCAFDTRDESAVRLRAYRSPSATHKMCKIWEAARATSAAPFYFPPVTISGKEYWDGGLAYNNPTHEVWAEAESLFSAKLVNCFISLGTGFSERKPKRSLFPVLGKGKKILQSVTNTQRVHTLMEERARNRGIPYFRFNASTARDKIGLADYQLLDTLEKHTVTYLKDEDTQTYIKQCAELLAHSSLRPAAPNIEPVVTDAPGLAHY